jgi:hypothetical protein
VREHLKFYRKLMKIPEITSEVPLQELTRLGSYQPTLSLNQTKQKQKQIAKLNKLTRLYIALIRKNERDVISLLQRIEM